MPFVTSEFCIITIELSHTRTNIFLSSWVLSKQIKTRSFCVLYLLWGKDNLFFFFFFRQGRSRTRSKEVRYFQHRIWYFAVCPSNSEYIHIKTSTKATQNDNRTEQMSERERERGEIPTTPFQIFNNYEWVKTWIFFSLYRYQFKYKLQSVLLRYFQQK